MTMTEEWHGIPVKEMPIAGSYSKDGCYWPLPTQEHPYIKLPGVQNSPPPSAKKPTVGVIPRRTWLHQRAVDLSRAIANYAEVAGYGNAYELIDELDEILEELKIPQQALND